jgi:FlaG/FlaF family flagellin (archaellin)
MGRLRTKLTYANVVATLCIVLVLSGGTAVAVTGGNFLLGKANSASSKTSLSAPIANKALQITNSSADAGATALGLTTANGHPPFVVNSEAKVKYLNADKLDGRDSGAFAQARAFQASTNTISDITEMLSFNGLTLSRSSNVTNNSLYCKLYVSSSAGGRYDAFITTGPSNSPATTYEGGAFTPITNDPFGNVGPSSSEVGQIVFIDLATNRVVTVQFSIVGYPSNGGCRWQGIAYAAS